MTADDVLYVLNELEPVPLNELEFCVITGYIPSDRRSSCWPFELGEVIVVNAHSHREPFGEGRRPAKWDVKADYFDNLQDAMAVRGDLLNA